MTSVATSRRRGVNSGIAVKVPCRVATTAAIVLSGEQTIDGVAVVSGDRVLVKNQASSIANGIYEADTGAWEREPDFDGQYDVKEGTLVKVNGGATMQGFWYVSTSGTPTPGTDSINFGMASSVLAVISAFGQTLIAAASASAARVLLDCPSNSEAILKTIGTTKGDFIGFTAASTPARHAVGTDGYGISASSGDTDGLRYLPPSMGFSLINGYLDWTVAGNALTCTVKGLDGNAPSSTNPVFFWNRSATVITGSPSFSKITSATTASLSSGSTAGARSTVPFRIWAVLFDDAGTYRLGLINCVTTVAGSGTGSDVTQIYPLAAWAIDSSTAEGGAGAADSAQTFYTTVTVTSKGYAPVGYATWEAGLATAGTWGTAPTRQHLWMPGTPLPGQAISAPRRTDTGAVSTGTTTIPTDDTIPQNTEGDQYMSQAITPTSAANPLRVTSNLEGANSVATNDMGVALFRDATANALAAMNQTEATASYRHNWRLEKFVLAESTTATTFKTRAGPAGAATFTFNGNAGARTYGGVMNSFMEVQEVMG